MNHHRRQRIGALQGAGEGGPFANLRDGPVKALADEVIRDGSLRPAEAFQQRRAAGEQRRKRARKPRPVEAKLAAARARLEETGLWSRLNDLAETDRQLSDDDLEQTNRDYYALRMPCPFLENEMCSIYEDRPAACRELLVLSPAELCQDMVRNPVRPLPVPVRISTVLGMLWAELVGGPARLVPLPVALAWAARHEAERHGVHGHDAAQTPHRILVRMVMDERVPQSDSLAKYAVAYLALMTVFPFFIVAASIARVFGRTGDGVRALDAFLRTVPPDVAEVLQKPIADVLAARAGKATGLAIIPEGMGSNAAETRWRAVPVLDPQRPDSTLMRWEIIKNKSGTNGAWHVRWDAAARRIIVVPPAGD